MKKEKTTPVVIEDFEHAITCVCSGETGPEYFAAAIEFLRKEHKELERLRGALSVARVGVCAFI
jgi:hypothetical protein